MKTHLALLLLALSASGAPALCAQTGPATPAVAAPLRSTAVVCAAAGKIQGFVETAAPGVVANAFLGIPYAESTGGANRWKAPVPKRAWSETFSATQYGPIPPQNYTDKSIPQSEDCLSINLWTPTDAKPGERLPVMIWIYGGGFITGRNCDPMYDGSWLASQRHVIVASINYRLGSLGYLALQKFGIDGNFGLLDQQLAIRWVHDNVAAFGGDAGKITLFGESAGSISVGIHLASAPDSQPLFRAGIMESNLPGVPLKTLAVANRYGEVYKDMLGVKSAEELRALPVDTILAADLSLQYVSTQLFRGSETFLLWTPVVDGKTVVREPVDGFAGGYVTKPFIIGTNANEGALFMESEKMLQLIYVARVITLFGNHFPEIFARYPGNWSALNNDQMARLITDYIFTASTKHFVLTHAQHPGAPQAWAYQFTHAPSFLVWGSAQDKTLAVHGDEMPFVFHTATHLGAQFQAGGENALSERMMTYWTNFARDLDPNGSARSAELPGWPAFEPKERSYKIFDLADSIVRNPFTETSDFWDKIGYDLRSPEGIYWPLPGSPTNDD